MDEARFYRELTAEFSQGDIFERVPLMYSKEEPLFLKRTTLSGKREGFEVASAELPNSSHPATSTLLVTAACDYTRAMLLTFDCENDKPTTKVLTFVLIRPVDAKMPEQDKSILRTNRKFAFFYTTTRHGRYAGKLHRLSQVGNGWRRYGQSSEAIGAIIRDGSKGDVVPVFPLSDPNRSPQSIAAATRGGRS